MAKKRIPVWLALIVLGVGGIVAAVTGLFLYMSLTAVPIHPMPTEIRSTQRESSSPRWVEAVEQARQIVRAGISEQNLPGLSIAVGAGDGLVWAEGFGWADTHARVPVTTDTRFRIQSASIPLTATLVGLLVEQGQLDLDGEIQTYVPAFPKKQWATSLRHVMGHVAGVRGDMGDEESLSEHCLETADGVKRFAGSPLRFEPGTRFHFSTYGWILVSAAVEAASGERFLTRMRSRLLDPLGMTQTIPDSSVVPPADRATFYYPRFAANPRYGPEAAREGDYWCFSGAGGFLSTPSDLVRFGLAISRGRILHPATLMLMQSSQRLKSGLETGYGLGWDLETVSIGGQPTVSIGHDGEYGIGGSTSFRTFPERGLVVAVTSNISFADLSTLAIKVAEVFAAVR